MPTNEAQVVNTDTKPPVQVKSMRDGLLFILDEHCEFAGLMEHLHELLFGEMQGVFDGPDVRIAVDYTGRVFDSEQAREVLSLFMQKPNFHLVEWGEHTTAKRTVLQSRTRLPGNHIYKGTVRAGQRLVFDGDVVIIGDVNPGGEVVATGDIYVFGKLAGIAHCGAAGNEQSVIAAAEFVPMQLRIASVVSRAPEESGRALHTYLEFAYIREGIMAVDKVQYMGAIRQLGRRLVAGEGERL